MVIPQVGLKLSDYNVLFLCIYMFLYKIYIKIEMRVLSHFSCNNLVLFLWFFVHMTLMRNVKLIDVKIWIKTVFSNLKVFLCLLSINNSLGFFFFANSRNDKIISDCVIIIITIKIHSKYGRSFKTLQTYMKVSHQEPK